jgi:hypothetical protein
VIGLLRSIDVPLPVVGQVLSGRFGTPQSGKLGAGQTVCRDEVGTLISRESESARIEGRKQIDLLRCQADCVPVAEHDAGTIGEHVPPPRISMDHSSC